MLWSDPEAFLLCFLRFDSPDDVNFPRRCNIVQGDEAKPLVLREGAGGFAVWAVAHARRELERGHHYVNHVRCNSSGNLAIFAAIRRG
jgi:hypothetical protein